LNCALIEAIEVRPVDSSADNEREESVAVGWVWVKAESLKILKNLVYFKKN
jgi:hypothetical protein